MRAWLQCSVRHGREGGLHRANGRKNQLMLPRGEGRVSQRRRVFKDQKKRFSRPTTGSRQGIAGMQLQRGRETGRVQGMRMSGGYSDGPVPHTGR